MMGFPYIIMDFFSMCWCGGPSSRRATLDPTSKHYQEIQETLSANEQAIIELIYDDLASRHHAGLLTFENFLLFFGLTGLWGAKLFRQFDESGRQLVGKEEFLVGLSRITKAPYEEKISQLFNFFKDREDNGIKYIDFTKMLYNYSRDELKHILMEDRAMLAQLNSSLTQGTPLTETLYRSTCTSLREQLQRGRVIELDYEEPKEMQQSRFRKHYSSFSEYRDPGTILQLTVNDLTYKVNYCNMITLVKEFAKRTYRGYHIDIKTGIFTLPQFAEWIQSHRQLFQSYYTSFHADIWTSSAENPNFLAKVEKSFQGSIRVGQRVSPIYGMLVEDVLILAESRKKRAFPFKVVFLEGLSMHEVNDEQGYGIQISHRDEYYQKFVIYFKLKEEVFDYLQLFSMYAGETLHDLYYSHEVIGTGTFSIVYRCTDKETGRTYALKDMSTEKLTKEAIAMLNNESEIMKVISHPQIVKYQQTIRSKAHIYIIAEYIPGKDLFTFVTKRKRLSEYVSAFIIGKIIEATLYLHSLEIVHRDLKPENIMVMLKEDSNDPQSFHPCYREVSHEECIENVKIIDFGFANHLSELKNTQKRAIAGTPNYIAPQIIRNDPPTLKSDTFSIGAILYFLLSGKLAFALESMEYTLVLTLKGQYDIKNGIWPSVSPEAKDLIAKMLEPDPNLRIDLEDALNHPWFEVSKKETRHKLSEEIYTGESSDDRPVKQQVIRFQNEQEVEIEAVTQGQQKSKKRM